jgi:MFS family permease
LKYSEYKKWFPDQFQDLDFDPEEEEIQAELKYQQKIDYAADSAMEIDLSDVLYPVVEFLAGSSDIRSNSLFIKFYKKAFRRPKVPPCDSFIFGIIAGAFFGVIGAICAIYYKTWFPFILILPPIFIPLLITWVRVGYSILFEGPMKIAREVDQGVIHSVYTTPMTDAEIYYGASMPYLVRSLVILETVFYFIGGYYLSCFSFNLLPVLKTLLSGSYDYSEYFLYCTIGLVVFAILIVFSLLLASRAIGLYSIVFSRVGTVWAAFGQSILAWVVIIGMGFMIIMPYFSIPVEISFTGKLFGILIGSGLMITAYWYACVLTAQIGIKTLGISRRGPRADPLYRRLRGNKGSSNFRNPN